MTIFASSNSTSTHTPSPCPLRPSIYHTSTTSYATSLSPRKSKHRNLILHDRRIFQYRALVKLKTVKFSDAELDALRNLAPHVECEKDLRKKVQEVRWRFEEEIHEVKSQAKENEARLRKELDLRFENQREVHRDNEKLLKENAALKSDVVAWEKENDKIMEANEVLTEELRVSIEDKENLRVSIESLSKEVNDLSKKMLSVTEIIAEAMDVSRNWTDVHTNQNEVFVKEREEMMGNDAQVKVMLQEMQARGDKTKWLEEADKDLVLKNMREEMQVMDEKIRFLVESEQERLNQLKGMRRERDGLPECGCVTPKCTCEEGAYKADDDMMECIRQHGLETNCETDSNYDADNTSDDWESEDYESDYESDAEDFEREEAKARRSVPAATAKLNDHKETLMEHALVEEKSKPEEAEELPELKEAKKSLPRDAKLKAEVVMPRKDVSVNGENNLREEEDAELKEADPGKTNSFSILSSSITAIETLHQSHSWPCLASTIISALTAAPSVSSENKGGGGLLWEEKNEGHDAARKWLIEKLASSIQQGDEAEEKRPADEAKVARLTEEAEEHKPVTDKKKKKKNKPKKKTPDPNAPKKPLAPFIFYMQTARLIIASDLGGLSPQDPLVDNEGQNRWNEMAESDKKLWISAYTDNLALYNARLHAYKNGFRDAGCWSDLQAIQHTEKNNVEPLPGGQLFLVNELTPAERKMVKARMKEQEMGFKGESIVG